MKNLKIFSRKFSDFLTRGAIYCIRGYQRLFSPDHGVGFYIFGISRCRFYPSCSEYAAEAVGQYGLLYGSVASLKRIVRCGPWSRGGYDPIQHKAHNTKHITQNT